MEPGVHRRAGMVTSSISNLVLVLRAANDQPSTEQVDRARRRERAPRRRRPSWSKKPSGAPRLA